MEEILAVTPFSIRLNRPLLSALVLVLFTLLAPASARAQVVIAPTSPVIGSANPVSAEPWVSRPATTPCKVSLFTGVEFGGNAQAYTFTPPTSCPGPWAKVVFSADITATGGPNYDRSAQVWLNNITLYRGTTAEPGSKVSPSWHVERDVTDLSSIFYAAGTGEANIQNYTDSTYTGVIWGNAELDFYPVSDAYPAPTVPDVVLPIYKSDANSWYTPASPLSETFSSLPTNIKEAYVDIWEQGQGNDEFWYFSTPNATLANYVGNNSTALREIDVTVDGTPAGVAPSHPYLFTGGIDPYLWRPIPGAQTLNLKPYRVNLTPFAGVLSNGNAHTIALINTDDVQAALVNGNLLLYLDANSKTVTGSVLTNTLTTTPAPNVTSSGSLDNSGDGTMESTETLQRNFTISGVVNTSAGAVTTTIDETVNFVNDIQLINSNSVSNEAQIDNLTFSTDSTVTTSSASGTTAVEFNITMPLHVNYSQVLNADGTYAVTTTVDMHDGYKQSGPNDYGSSSEEEVTATDTLNYDASGNYTGHSNANTQGTYASFDTDGNSYSKTLTAAGNVLTATSGTSNSRRVDLTLGSNSTTVAQGSSVTFTATLTPVANTQVPSGYVTFYANGSSLGAVTPTAGVAMLATSALPSGSNAITAEYSGDSNFNSTVSPAALAVTVTALAPSFTLGTLSPASLTLKAGSTGIITLPITANATFSGTVTFVCSGVPSETSCTVNPSSTTLAAGQSANVSVVVATTAPNNSTEAANHAPSLGKIAGSISFAGFCLIFLPKRRRRIFVVLAFLVAGFFAATSLSGCSSSTHYTYAGSTPGTYTLQVTATSGSVSQVSLFSLVISKN
jgi:hypothetical protein